MRKVAALFVLLCVVAGAVAYVARNLEAYLRDRREWIAARAAEALAREVSFADVGVTLRGGLGAQLFGLKIGDDPAFSDRPFAEVDEVRLQVDFLSALRGEFIVTRVLLVQPRVVIIRTQRGLSIDSIGGARNEAAAAPAAATGSRVHEELPLLISVLEVRDGAVRYIDRIASPAREYTVADVNGTLAEIGSERPVDVHAAGRLVDERRADVHVEGNVGPLRGVPDVSAIPLALRASVGPLSIDALKRHDVFAAIVPAQLESADPLRVDATIGGTLRRPMVELAVDATAAQVRFGAHFLKPSGVPLQVTADVELARDVLHVRGSELRLGEATARLTGKIRMEPKTRWELRLAGEAIPLAGWERMLPALAGHALRGQAVPELRITGTGTPRVAGKVGLEALALSKDGVRIEDVNAIVAIDGDQVTLPMTPFRVNGAALTVAGRYDGARDDFEVSSAAHGLLLGPLLAAYAPQAARVVDGVVDAELQLSGRGSTWEAIRSALKGSGRFQVRDGILRELNVAEEVLVALTGMKGLTGMLAPEVRAKYANWLQAHDTTFEDMSGRVQITAGSAQTEDFRLQAAENLITGAGSLGLDGELDFRGAISFAPPVTDDLVRRVRSARGLVAADGRLEVPFRLKGKLPGARPVPDFDFVLRRVGRDVLESGIDKLFRKHAGEADHGVEAGEATPTVRAEERLLRRGLENLLGR